MSDAPARKYNGLYRSLSGTRREKIYGVEIRGKACAYCALPAVNGDHVIPRSLIRRYNANAVEGAPSIPSKWLAVVPSCFACNILKGTRRLVPPSWAGQVNSLNRFFGGSAFRVWTGDIHEPAFTAVHK